MREVSELKEKIDQLEKQIELENQRRYAFQNISNVGSFEYDIENKKCWMSSKLAEQLRVDNGDIAGISMSEEDMKEIFEKVVDDEGVNANDIVKQIINEDADHLKKEYIKEYKYILKGEYRYLSVVGIPIVKGGKITHVMSISRDITDKKRQEEELMQAKHNSELSNEKMISVLETLGGIEEVVGAAASEYNVSDRSMWLSKFTASIYGIEADIEGINIDNDTRVMLFGAVSRILDTGEKVSIGGYGGDFVEFLGMKNMNVENIPKMITQEWLFEPAPGMLLYFESNIKFNVVDGKLKTVSFSSLDITKRKMRENELIKAKEKAEAASASQGRFVANVSHEIRTPLNAILGYAEILRTLNIDEKADYYINAIDLSGNVLLDIVTDILDYAKINAGKFKSSLTPCNIGDFCEELKILFWKKLDIKNLDFEMIYDTDLPTFLLPISIIRQIMINLIGNAIKFTDEGGVTIKIACEKNDDDYNIDFMVMDTGIGISKEKQEIIFKEFEQADESHQKSGTGLGLAISSKFAQVCGGEIFLESETGKGSIFSFKLKNVKKSKREIASIHRKNEIIDFSFKKQKVMIVDDIEDNRAVLYAHCENLNLLAKTYSSPIEALKNLETYRPDIILSDLRMPKMNGEEFAKLVRGENDIPIICITASIDPSEKCNLKHFDDVLNKPIASSVLAKAMAKYLETNKIGVEEEFSIKSSLDSIELTEEDFLEFREKFLNDAKELKMTFNPKKIKKLAKNINEYAETIDNIKLTKYADFLMSNSEKLNVTNMIKGIEKLIAFLEKW